MIQSAVLGLQIHSDLFQPGKENLRSWIKKHLPKSMCLSKYWMIFELMFYLL